MRTGYSWEGIRQVRATLLGARHVPERLCGDRVYLGRYTKCSFESQVVISYRYSIDTKSVSATVVDIMGPKYNGVMTLTFLVHVTSSVT